MHYGASNRLIGFAKEMRENPTEAEKVIWRILRTEQLKKFHFRNQHPIGPYIADFYSHQLKLVIEIDGGYHLQKHQKEYDDFRDGDMRKLGIEVARFTNDEIFNDEELVMLRLKNIVVRLSGA
jgi:very-short-patch-repair endonuclease